MTTFFGILELLLVVGKRNPAVNASIGVERATEKTFFSIFSEWAGRLRASSRANKDRQTRDIFSGGYTQVCKILYIYRLNVVCLL